MNQSKVSIVVSEVIEKIEKIAGGCWAVFWGLIALYSMFDDEADGAGLIIFLWVLCAVGIVIYLTGRKRTKMRLEFKKYVMQLSMDPSGSLEELAAATGTTVDIVKSRLRYMIEKKFFTDAFINEQTNQLILPSIAQKTQQLQTARDAAPDASPQEWIVCTCPHCGALNKLIKGTVGKCDFCGSLLQG